MKNFIFFTILLLLTQCRNEKTTKPDITDKQAEFFVINYESILENKKTISLSDIASEVRYIPLETRDNCLIFRKPDYYFSNEYVFIDNYDHILAYDYSGKFIHQIGTPGRGPNEINLIRTTSVIEKERTIVVQTSGTRKLIFFSFDGTPIKSSSLPGSEFEICLLNIDQILFKYSCAVGNEDYLYLLTNESWDTISTVSNHFKWTNNTGLTGMISYDNFKPFYNYHDQTFFKSMYNDTVFTVIDEKIKPVFFFDLGKFRLPDDLRPEPPQSALKFRFGSERENYYFASIMEAGEMMFITTGNYKTNTQKNLLFKNNTSEGYLLVNQSNEPSGFVNDWDGGVEFWPEGSVNDNEIFMTISPLTLKKILNEGDFNSKTAQFPDKKEALKEMIEKLNETDNPVLMLIKLKE